MKSLLRALNIKVRHNIHLFIRNFIRLYRTTVDLNNVAFNNLKLK